ncbi:uncharacterized protein LOC135082548 [Ostrinia nubilalis]|uniref:uncharacterized protein LOC135082548 n=1 Tax=Ostrinia nubilalis TaxID=29057 RepID=UPI003082591B
MESVYRLLIALSIYLVAVSSAPQDSAVTDALPPPEDTHPRLAREPESLPVTIGRESLDSPVTIGAINVDNEATTQYPTSFDNQRQREEYPTETTAATDNTEVETTELIQVKPKAKFPSPRYISKLSYFKKSEEIEGSPLNNFLERTGKRKFRSRCRCEKIWNCPKLQITVPRCPDEYFLCCF